jgi:AcrR family transcriptional regulator
MGRRRQVSDRQISAAAREVFLDQGPKAPVAMVAKKLGVSTATLFQRTGSKQQLMLMALQPEGTVITELERGVQPGVAVREQLSQVLIELNEYLGTIIGGSVTLRAAGIEAELPEPTPQRLRLMLAQWLAQATSADVLIGTLESRHIHAYMQQEQLLSKQHREYIHAMLDVVLPTR